MQICYGSPPSLLLPVGVRKLWTLNDVPFSRTDRTKSPGQKCLVAWDNVCKANEAGGLGIKRLDTPGVIGCRPKPCARMARLCRTKEVGLSLPVQDGIAFGYMHT
jgi:hypothetical protein